MRKRSSTPLAPAGSLDGADFRQWLLLRYGQGRLSAKHVCTAAWACRNRGLDVDDLALSPLSQTGHFQRKLDEALGINSWVDEHVYWADVPSHDHRTNTRTQLRHPMLLVHERVADEFAENVVAPPEAERDELLALPRFRSCPLLRELGWDRLALLGFYIDSAPWSNSD